MHCVARSRVADRHPEHGGGPPALPPSPRPPCCPPFPPPPPLCPRNRPVQLSPLLSVDRWGVCGPEPVYRGRTREDSKRPPLPCLFRTDVLHGPQNVLCAGAKAVPLGGGPNGPAGSAGESQNPTAKTGRLTPKIKQNQGVLEEGGKIPSGNCADFRWNAHPQTTQKRHFRGKIMCF